MDAAQMAKLLEVLGCTPDDVASSLQASGVRGVRNTVRFLNPIVRYVQERIRGDARSLDLMQGDRLRLTLGNGRKVEAFLPEPVRLFLDAFHGGRYPELELPGDGL
jgi:hypothetical protein